MQATMQDFPLTLQHILWRAEKLFRHKEIVTKQERGVHRYTYGDFVARVNRLAGALTRLGIRPGDRVATLAWNNYRHLEAYYAVPCMGAVLHTLNLRLFPDQLAFVINDAEDRIILADRTLLPILEKVSGRIPKVEKVIVLDDEYEKLLAEAAERYQWPVLDERSAAAICYTSGTTGNPKGVVYSHRSNMLHTLVAMHAAVLGGEETDAILPVVPMFHANSWGIPYTAIMAGAKLLLPDRWMGDGKVLAALAIEERATFLAGVPTIWVNLVGALEASETRLPEVHSVVCGGSAIPRSLMERMDKLGLKLIHAWGMTETSPLGTVARPRSWQHPDDPLAIRLTQGAAAPFVEIRIMDTATREELPWDGKVFGEIEVRGPWVASGYHNAADPGRLTKDGWFKTGDVARIDEDGFVTIVDRTKDVIKSGGEWISSVELENAVMGHPKVLEAAVIGLPHKKWQERPVAYVVPRPEHKGAVTADEIKSFLRDKVAEWWLPDEVRLVDEIPKTSVGKFDKKVLRAQAAPLTK